MELEFNNDRIQFRKEGVNNLIVDTAIGKYNEIEVDIIINRSTQIVDNDMIENILNYVHKKIVQIERIFKPLLENLCLKFNEHLQQPIELDEIEFEFVDIWIESINPHEGMKLIKKHLKIEL